jgi:hypothetical protein
VSQLEWTDSVRRSIEAVTEGLELHLRTFTSIRRTPDSLQHFRDFEGGGRRQVLPRLGVITTAADRLSGSSTIAQLRTDSH